MDSPTFGLILIIVIAVFAVLYIRTQGTEILAPKLPFYAPVQTSVATGAAAYVATGPPFSGTYEVQLWTTGASPVQVYKVGIYASPIGEIRGSISPIENENQVYSIFGTFGSGQSKFLPVTGNDSNGTALVLADIKLTLGASRSELRLEWTDGPRSFDVPLEYLSAPRKVDLVASLPSVEGYWTGNLTDPNFPNKIVYLKVILRRDPEVVTLDTTIQDEYSFFVEDGILRYLELPVGYPPFQRVSNQLGSSIRLYADHDPNNAVSLLVGFVTLLWNGTTMKAVCHNPTVVNSGIYEGVLSLGY